MKNLITLILALLVSGVAFGHDVELRFTENRVEGDLLFIDIDIKATDYDLNLASHSIRAYYDHAALELVDITSQLPEAKYSSPAIEQMFTDGHNVELGILPFEDHMGFINMSVQLDDSNQGGVDISTEWTTVHTATFKIIDDSRKGHIVWANEAKTSEFATAFVEVAEWVNADEIIAKRAFDLVNFEEDINTAVQEEVAFEVKIGPNPTSSVANIYQDVDGALLSVINMSGSTVIEQSLQQGTTTVNVEGLSSGSYIFLVSQGAESHAEQVMITD